MATEQQKDAIALRIALGEAPGEIAAGLGHAQSWIRNLLGAPDMQGKVRAVQQRIEDSAARARLKLLFAAPQLIDSELSIANDSSHRDQGNMLRYLTDKLWPQRTIIEQRTEHRLDADLTGPLVETLNTIVAKMRAADSNPPRLLEGDAALPHREIDVGNSHALDD